MDSPEAVRWLGGFVNQEDTGEQDGGLRVDPDDRLLRTMAV